MAAHTALDVITASLRRLGVLSGIGTPGADLAEDSLARLNSLLESWRTESLVVYHRDRISLPLIANKQFYRIGPGGDIDRVRPLWIYDVGIETGAAGNEYTLTPLSEDEVVALTPKWMASAMAQSWYYNAQQPLGELLLWPTPNVAGGLLVLYLPAPLPNDITLSTVLDLPPGYERAIRENLALEMAPELGRPIDPMLLQIAIEAKAAIQRVNFRPRELQLDPAVPGLRGGDYDWQADE